MWPVGTHHATDFLAQVLALLLLLHPVLARVVGPFPDGIPGSGYGCDRVCNDADVNYVIRASLETYMVPNTRSTTLSSDGKQDVSMFTFTGIANESSPFCRNDDGTTGPLGPCLTVNPGHSLKIKVINDMNN
jgi:hypothetical protein